MSKLDEADLKRLVEALRAKQDADSQAEEAVATAQLSTVRLNRVQVELARKYGMRSGDTVDELTGTITRKEQ